MTSRNASHMVCPGCQSVYLRSIRACTKPETGQFSCTICGKIVARWHTPYVPIYTISDQAPLLRTKPFAPPRNTKFVFAEATANEIYEPRTFSPFFDQASSIKNLARSSIGTEIDNRPSLRPSNTIIIS